MSRTCAALVVLVIVSVLGCSQQDTADSGQSRPSAALADLAESSDAERPQPASNAVPVSQPEPVPESAPAVVPEVAPEVEAGRPGAGTVPLWNPYQPAADNLPLVIRVLVLNYDPLVPSEGNRRLSEVFRWNDPARLAADYKDALEYASGGLLRFDIVEWRNLNEIYAQRDGYRYKPDEYVFNRRSKAGWHDGGGQDYPRLIEEQNVVPLVDSGAIDEVWIFSDHFFGLWEASMAGPGAFNINGGVYPEVPSHRPFAFYGFNYERSVAEMLHNTSHRTEAMLNRIYGQWKLDSPESNWDRFSANHQQSNGAAGVGTCHWPANATHDYDYGNPRIVQSWADDFLNYPVLAGTTRPVSRSTWSTGPDYHRDYMKWYFTHLPRAAGTNPDGRQNNWWKYLYDFINYTSTGEPLPATAQLRARDLYNVTAASHTLQVAYSSPRHIEAGSISDDDLLVTGPAGSNPAIRLVSVSSLTNRSHLVATYQLTPSDGQWPESGRGEYTVTLRPDQVRQADGTPLPGQVLGTFRTGATTATELAADEDTLLLLQCDNARQIAAARPRVNRQVRITDGVIGRGVQISGAAALTFPCQDRINPDQGTIEFWIRPGWNPERKQHTFLQAGHKFNNGLLMLIDGANNVRVILWGDDPQTPAVETNVERGVGTSGAGWKAGQWRHLATTWNRSEQTLALYIDGSLVSEIKTAVTIPQFSTPDLWIGSEVGGGASADAAFDEIRISRRARSAAEIRRSYEMSRGIDSLAADSASLTLILRETARLRITAATKGGITWDVTSDMLWSTSDSAVAAVDPAGVIHARQAGTAAITARLGNLSLETPVTVADSDLPTAALEGAPEVSQSGEAGCTFAVTFTDREAIRVDTLGFGDVRVVGPRGFQQFAEFVAVDRPEDGSPRTARYRINPPGGRWSHEHEGMYTIEVKAFQVGNHSGQYVADGQLGTFSIGTSPSAP